MGVQAVAPKRDASVVLWCGKALVTLGTVCLRLPVAMVSPGNDLHFGTVW